MHKNAEIVRRGYQAFNTGDMKALTALRRECLLAHAGPGLHRWRPGGPGRGFCPIRSLCWGEGGTFQAELRHVLADDEG